MSSRAEEEAKYRDRRNQKTKHKPSRPEVESSTSKSSTEIQNGFKKFFLLTNGPEKLIIAVVVSFFCTIPVIRWFKEDFDVIQLVLTGTAVFLGLMLLVFLYGYSLYNRYLKFVEARLYPVQGWSSFIKTTSTEFWSEKVSVYIKIKLNQHDDASMKDKQALHKFCTNWVNTWASKYSQSNRSDGFQDFKLSGFCLEGHMRLGAGSAFVIAQLTSVLPDLVTTLTRDQLNVEISSGREVAIKESPQRDDFADGLREEARLAERQERLDHQRDHGHKHG